MAIFQPIKGTEEKIMLMGKKEGYVYFATDSGKIYLDINDDERISVGGSGASIYYSSCQQVNRNSSGQYLIPKTDLDDPNASLKADDLIVNINGSFYKIQRIDETMIYCALLAISGTGGGGGGSGSGDSGGGSTGNSIVWVTLDGIKTGDIFIEGQPSMITMKANNTLGNSITYNIEILTEYAGITTTESYQVGDTTYDNNTEVLFDLGSKMKLGTSFITITASADDCGIAIRERTNIKTVVMKLEDAGFNATDAKKSTDIIQFDCRPVGAGLKKKLTIYLDGKYYDHKILAATTSGSNETFQIEANYFTHGRHTITAVLANEAETVSCSLSYQIAVFDGVSKTPIIWLGNHEAKIVNHSNMIIPYMVYNPDVTAHGISEVYYYVNSVRSNSSYTIEYNKTTWQNWIVANYVVGLNELKIETVNGQAEAITSIEVEEDVRQLDIVSGAYLNYDATGRSNNENISSRQTWISTGSNHTNVTFNNFNWYNNGWYTDKDNRTCLRISNGASISIPLQILNSTSLGGSYTFDFMFKLRNIKQYSNLIQTIMVGEGDEAKPEKHILFDENMNIDGAVIKYYNSGIGFALGTQEGFLSSANRTISARYAEDRIVHVSFVLESFAISTTPLLYMYIDGVLSAVIDYNNQDNFAAGAKAIEINSDYCDVDLYKLRVYASNLTSQDIVRNYIADYKSIELYDMNMDIVTYNKNIPTVDFKKMCEYNATHPDNLLIPYAVIETEGPDHILPYKKDTGDAWTVNIEFKNTYLDEAWKNREDNGMTEEQYLRGIPSYSAQGVNLNVQGTSSQGYPRRNYKAKFKSASNWVYTDGPKAGEEIENSVKNDKKTYKGIYFDGDVLTNKFTWKADYMESSRTHNTGFASFVNILYSKHPLEDYGVSKAIASKYRTTIYGFPMMVFHKYGNGENDYEFIGLYNYNLDKGCDENFGFCDISGFKSKVKDADGNALSFKDVAECWQLEHNQPGRCHFMYANFKETTVVKDEEGNIYEPLTAKSDYEVRYHKDIDNIELAVEKSWDQDEKHINFRTKTQEETNEYLYNKMKNLEEVVEWVASTNISSCSNAELPSPVTYGAMTYTIDNQEYRLAKFRAEFMDHFDLEYSAIYFITTELFLCYDSRGKNMMLATWGPHTEGGNYIWYPIFYDIDTQMGINNSGVPYWDYWEEATTNNTFSTATSVFWNNFWRVFKADIIDYYDKLRVDTKLGITGVNGYYDFNAEISKSYAMHGECPAMAINVDEYYKYINCSPRGSGYKDTNNETRFTSGFFYCLQGTRQLQRQLFLRNRLQYVDSWWQAGTFSKTGSQQGSMNLRFNANKNTSTSDKFLYYDKEKVSPEEKAQNEEKGYVYFDKYPEKTPNAYNDLDANLDFKCSPYLKSYVSAYIDDQKSANIYANDTDTIDFFANSSSNIANSIKSSLAVQQSILRFPGAAYIRSLGNLSDKYIDQFYVTEAIRLEDIILGNDNKVYRNDLMNETTFQLGAEATNECAKRMLKKVVLSNLTSLSYSLDLSGSEKLEEFRALGTKLPGVTLADACQIKTLHLPETVKSLILKDPTSLKKYLDHEPIEDNHYTDEEGIYIASITDKKEIKDTDNTLINILNIEGGKMGYGSYKILDVLTRIKQNMQQNPNLLALYSKYLNINLTDVEWSPYRLVEYGEVPYSYVKITQSEFNTDKSKYYILNSNQEYVNAADLSYNAAQSYYIIDKEYYIKTEHYTFEKYQVPNVNWNNDTRNSKIYCYEPEIGESNITDLSLLDVFIENFENADFEQNYFRDTSEISTGDFNNRLPRITGRIFINNTLDNPIKESDIRNYYNASNHFPDLEIYVKHIAKSYSVKFIKVDLNSDGDEVETEIDSLKYEIQSGTTQYPTCTGQVPFKLHYDFYGWSLDKNANYGYGPVNNGYMHPWSELTLQPFSDSKDSYVFYAIFKIHTYTFNFQNTPYENTGSSGLQIPYGKPIAFDSDSEPKSSVLGYLPWAWQTPDKWGTISSLEAFSDIENPRVYHLVGWRLWGDEGYYSVADLSHLTPNELCDSRGISTEEAIKLYPAYELVPFRENIYPKIIKVHAPDNSLWQLSGAYVNYTEIITLPTKDYNNKDILALGNNLLNSSNNVQGIYLQDYQGSKINTLYESCFSNLINLKHIELPPLITTIPQRCFVNCRSLEVTENFFNNIEDIENYAFMGCNNLRYVNLPKIKMLRMCSFKNCEKLETITIGQNSNTPLALMEDNNYLLVGSDPDKDGQTFRNDDGASIDNQNNITLKLYGSNLNIANSDTQAKLKILLKRLFKITNNNYPTVYCNDIMINTAEYFE